MLIPVATATILRTREKSALRGCHSKGRTWTRPVSPRRRGVLAVPLLRVRPVRPANPRL